MKKVQGLNLGPLGPTWKGPFRVLKSLSNCTYKLETMDHKKFNHLWNIERLKKYYQQVRKTFAF